MFGLFFYYCIQVLSLALFEFVWFTNVQAIQSPSGIAGFFFAYGFMAVMKTSLLPEPRTGLSGNCRGHELHTLFYGQ
jgi:hypothetical protein